MYELKKIGKVFTSKFVRTGPLSYKKRIYRATVSQRLRNTAIEHESSQPHLNETQSMTGLRVIWAIATVVKLILLSRGIIPSR